MIETPEDILAHACDDMDAIASFIKWRKRKRSPLTERAAVKILGSLREIVAKGGDAADALDLAQEHGWVTVKPEWYWRQRQDGNALSREIDFAAGFARSPCPDWH